MNPGARRAIRYAEYALVTALFALSAYVGANYAFGTQTIYVVGDNPSSMSPTINYGDLTLTYRAPFTGLQVGDIVFFHDPRGNPGITVHRIVSVGTCGGQFCVQTKGDNSVTNPTRDPWNLTAPFYLSQVVLVIPKLGYLSPALWGLGGTLAILPLTFVALLVIFVAYGRRVARSDGQAKEGDHHG